MILNRYPALSAPCCLCGRTVRVVEGVDARFNVLVHPRETTAEAIEEARRLSEDAYFSIVLCDECKKRVDLRKLSEALQDCAKKQLEGLEQEEKPDAE